MAGGTVAGVQETPDGYVQRQVQLLRAPEVRRLAPEVPGLGPERLGHKGLVPLAEGLHLDAETERRRSGGPRGGDRQDADNVRVSARDEASGAGTQADDYRAESQRARDCRDLPQGLSQRPHPLRLGEGLCRRQPCPFLQRHPQQRLGLCHHVA